MAPGSPTDEHSVDDDVIVAEMIRMQVRLTGAQVRGLKTLAGTEGRSMANLIRDGVEMILRAKGVVDREAVQARSLAAIGRYRSGARDLGSKHDFHLAAAFDADFAKQGFSVAP